MSIAVCDKQQDDFVSLPGILALIISGMLVYHYHWFHYLSSWKFWVWSLVIYLVAGFCVSLYKWFMVLFDFKKNLLEINSAVQNAKVKISGKTEAPLTDTGMAKVVKDLTSYWNGHYCVGYVGDSIKVYPNWIKHPIAMWWMYWPAYSISVILDPIQRLVRNLVDWMKRFYDSIARRFSIVIK